MVGDRRSFICTLTRLLGASGFFSPLRVSRAVWAPSRVPWPEGVAVPRPAAGECFRPVLCNVCCGFSSGCCGQDNATVSRHATVHSRHWVRGGRARCVVCAQAGVRGGRGVSVSQEPPDSHGAGRRVRAHRGRDSAHPCCPGEWPVPCRIPAAHLGPCPRPCTPARVLLGPHADGLALCTVESGFLHHRDCFEGCRVSARLAHPCLSSLAGGWSACL